MAVCATAAGAVAAVIHTVVSNSNVVMTTSGTMSIFKAEDSINLTGIQLFRAYDMKDEQENSAKSLANTEEKRTLALLIIIVY
jgi:hypothetical protein